MRSHRRFSARTPIAILLGGALACAAALVTLAYWTSAGAGNASANVGTLAAPTITSATPSAGAVTLTWSAVTPPGAGAVTYSVQRGAASAGGTCPTTAAPSGVTTCTDSGLAAGTYAYTITARWRGWTAIGTVTNVGVNSGGATKLALAAATTTPTSGAANNLTITAKDAANLTVTSYAGDRSLTFSGDATIGAFAPTVTDKSGAAVTLGTATTITFVNGVATVTGSSNGAMKLYKAESANIVVSDGAISNGAGLAVTVGAGTAAKLGFTQQPAGSTGGVALPTQPKVAIQDLAGNTVTSSTNSIAVALSSPGSASLSCTTNPLAAFAGVASLAGCKVDLAGTYTLTATSTSLAAATSATFTISVGAAAKLTFTQQPGPSSGGVALATQPKVAIQDLGGNTVTSNTSTVTLTLTTPGSATLTCTANTLSAVAGVAAFAGCKVDLTGTYTLTAAASSLSSATSSSFMVSVGAAAKLAFTQQPGASTGGVVLTTQAKVTIQDLGGNTVTSSTVPVTLALTTPNGATLTCATNPLAAVTGIVSFAGCKVDLAGSYTLTATSSGLLAATSGTFVISVGAAAKLGFSQQPGASTGGIAIAAQPKVAIQDLGGNTLTSNTSTVSLTLTTAGTATLACTTNPLAAVAGVATFTGCIVDVAATYTLTATDGVLTAAVSNSFTITVGPAAKLAFSQQPGGATANIAFDDQPAITIQDLGGNTVTTDTSSVTLALTIPGAATLACATNPVAAAAGVAAFTDCDVDVPDDYTLTASDGTLTPVESDVFTIDLPGVVTALATGNWNAVDTWKATALIGTITTAASSKTVSGTGTQFLSELSIGDRILRKNGATSIGIVQSIASDTSLTLVANASSNNTSVNFTARRIPTIHDAVSIVGSYTITIPASYAASANSITIGNTSNKTAQTVSFASATSSLSTAGNLTMNAPSGNNSTRGLTVNAGTLTVGGDLKLMANANNASSSRINRITITTGVLTITGDLVLNAGNVTNPSAAQNQLLMSGGSGTVNLAGAFTINGGAGTPAATLTPGPTSTFNFNGTAEQTIPLGVSGVTYANLTTNNTSASGATIDATISSTSVAGNLRVLSGKLSNGGFPIGLASSRTFEVANGATFTMTGTSGIVTGTTLTKIFGPSSTVSYAGTNQTISNETYGNLALDGSSTKTATPGTTTVTGNFTNSGGTFVSGTSTFSLTGAGTTIGGTQPTTFNNLTIGAAISLNGIDATVTSTLALGTNILSTTSNKVIANGTLTRSSGFVNGRLQKPIAAGASLPIFEVGTGTTYTPVSLALVGASTGGTLTASSTTGQQPSFASSGISPTKYVNRYWTLTPGGGLTATSYTATFTFVAADLAGNPNTAALVARRFVSPNTWTAGTAPSSIPTTVTGAFTTSFGDYAAGE